MRTLERLAGAVSVEIHATVFPAMTREERRSLEFHQAIADLLVSDPDAYLDRARSNLGRLRRLRPGAQLIWERWNAWLNLPVDDLVVLMLGFGEVARELRHASPFSGILTAAQRTMILQRFREEEESEARRR